MSGELVPVRTSGPAASVIRAGRRGFEYLGKNGDQGVGVMIRLLVLLFGAGLVWYNIDAIYHFVDTAVKTGTVLIKGTFVAAALFVLWKFFSNRRLHYMVAQMIDQTIMKAHMAWIDRDKFGSAVYAIGRLKKLVSVAEDAKGVISGVLEQEDAAIKESEQATRAALRMARGFELELERRRSGSGHPPSTEVAELSDVQLVQSMELAKAELRAQYEFHQGEGEYRVVLAEQVEQVSIMIDAIHGRVRKLETDLALGQKKWNLSQKRLVAAEAAATVIEGPEIEVYQRALAGIKSEAFAFEGQVRRYMDMLRPTIRSYQADRAASSIADAAFYREFAESLGVDEKEVKTKIQAALPPATAMPDVEEILGSPTAKREPVPVPARSSGGRDVDELIRRRRR